MRGLVLLTVPTLQSYSVRPGEVQGYRAALRKALDASGPALAPTAGPPVEMAPTRDRLPNGLALIVSTSGSTGTPKRAMLTADSLTTSADATHERLGGPGQWLLAMPAQHIAGTQVIVRSLRADTELLVLDQFDTAGFAALTAQLTHERAYTALVPTQLSRLLEVDPTSLRRYAAILLGGAAAAPALLAQARDAGLRVLTTYGMSETAGGCFYDGKPLTGTSVSLDVDGRISIAGPTVAQGYLADAERTAVSFDLSGSVRTFHTDDLGELRDGVLHVMGRRDDVIVTGGMKVSPSVVEAAASALPGIGEVVALGLPDPEWGQVVSLAIVSSFGHAQRGRSAPLRMSKTWGVRELREALRDSLPAYALPRRVLIVARLPSRGPGKPDRAALAALPGWDH